MSDLVEFVEEAAMEANDPLYGIKPRKAQEQPSIRGTSLVTTASVNTTDCHTPDYEMDNTMDNTIDNTTDITRKAPECAVCHGKHSTTKCRTLLRMGHNERFSKVRELNLCFVCLKPGHGSRVCKVDRRCEVSGCQRRHATLLHGAPWPSSSNMDTSHVGLQHTRIVQAGSTQDNTASPSGAPVGQSRGPDARGPEAPFSGQVAGSNDMSGRKVALPIVAVRIKVPNSDSYLDTYALLDSGSTHTFCTEELLDTLRIEGRREPVAISTLGGYSYDHAARVTDLTVSDMYGNGGLVLRGVHSKASLPGLMGHVGTAADIERWPHLRGLSIPQARADQVALLIGQDNAEALVPLSTIFGRRGEPYAIRTCLGWTLHGVLMDAQGGRPGHTCLVAADCGSSEQAVQHKQEAERGTRDPVHQSSAHHLCTSPSAGPKRSSGRRSKRRRRKESGVSEHCVVLASLPATVDQSSTRSTVKRASLHRFRRALGQRKTTSCSNEEQMECFMPPKSRVSLRSSHNRKQAKQRAGSSRSHGSKWRSAVLGDLLHGVSVNEGKGMVKAPSTR